jgi:prepilin-type N-terminal cleavage/methylation domain-containing protein
MKLSHKQGERLLVRSAFTLVEILIVLAIILVLVALLAGAVYNAMSRGPQVQARSELGQLDSALGAFKARYGSYPPSRITLWSSVSKYGSTPLDLDSVAYLKSVFPALASSWSSVNWGGGVGNDGATLSGDQCLVFFLGGIPSEVGGVRTTLGFNTGNNPANVGSGAVRFYEFPSARLVKSTTNNYFSFQDPWGTPYAFHSSYSWKSPNSFNRYTTSDCANLKGGDGPAGPSPYYLPATVNQGYNRESGQIISAGPDMQFGGGGSWSQNNLNTGVGADDLSNFHGYALGVSG